MPSVKGNACLYCINSTKFGQLILRKIIKIYCHQMSDFKAKMYQIRFRLRLRPRPRWGSLQRSPNPLAGFKGAASRQLGRGKGKGWGKGGDGKGREDEGREGKGNGGGKGKGKMGGTGQGMGWGRERERRKGREREERGYSPQTLIPGAATACYARRHNDLAGHSNFSSTIYCFSILCSGDEQLKLNPPSAFVYFR